MNQFSRFYVEFFTEIWHDILYFFENAVWKNTILRFFQNLKSYYDLLLIESQDFTIISWIMVVATFILNISLIVFLLARIILWFRKFASFRAIEIEKNELIEEIARLNDRVIELADEKNQILALKVSQLGINAKTGEMGETTTYARGPGGAMAPVFAGDMGGGPGRPGKGGGATYISAGGGGGGTSRSEHARRPSPSQRWRLVEGDPCPPVRPAPPCPGAPCGAEAQRTSMAGWRIRRSLEMA